MSAQSAPIPQFAASLATAGIEAAPQDILAALDYQVLLDYEGNPLVIAVYHLDPDANTRGEPLEGDYPILIARQATPENKWVWSETTLRSLATSAAVQVGVLLLGDRDLTVPIEQREFNLGVATFSWTDHVQPSGAVDLAWTDSQLEVARQGRMKIRLQHLLMPGDTPPWVGELPRPRLLDLTDRVISGVVGHYRGSVAQYVVVNEPYIVPYRPDDPFHRILGPESVQTAFQDARRAYPSAILIYNDSDNHLSTGMTTALTRQHSEGLRSLGLIDGVGVQMHLGSTSRLLVLEDADDIIRTLRSYALPVYVTELDVDISELEGSPEEKLRQQAQVFRIAVQAALASGVCESISFWGVGDRFSWLEGSPDGSSADPTLFDDHLNPKPAYYAVSSALLDHLRALRGDALPSSQ